MTAKILLSTSRNRVTNPVLSTFFYDLVVLGVNSKITVRVLNNPFHESLFEKRVDGNKNFYFKSILN